MPKFNQNTMNIFFSALLHNIVLQDHVHDKWKWLLDPIHGYSMRGAYQFLTFADEPLDRDLIDNV